MNGSVAGATSEQEKKTTVTDNLDTIQNRYILYAEVYDVAGNVTRSPSSGSINLPVVFNTRTVNMTNCPVGTQGHFESFNIPYPAKIVLQWNGGSSIGCTFDIVWLGNGHPEHTFRNNPKYPNGPGQWVFNFFGGGRGSIWFLRKSLNEGESWSIDSVYDQYSSTNTWDLLFLDEIQ